MRIEGVELSVLALSLRRPVGTSQGVHGDRPLIVVRLLAGGLEGWGECAALVGGTSVDPPLSAVWSTLVTVAVPRLFAASRARGGDLPPAPLVGALFGGGAPARMAAAALEMAVLDLELRAAGTALGARLGATADTVAVGGVAGIPADGRAATLVATVDELVDRGVGRVRLKIRPGWDLRPVGAVRERHPDLALQVDANGAYRLGSDREDGADRLGALDRFGLVCVEQPLAPPDLEAHARLAERIATPVCLDESLGSPRRVVEAIRYRALEVACIKPARLGGLFAARQALARCREAGVAAFVGGFFEAGLGRAANLAVAGLPGAGLAGDLGAPTDYLDDPFGYPEVRRGRVALPGSPGVGPAPGTDRRSRLARLTREQRWLPAPR